MRPLTRPSRGPSVDDVRRSLALVVVLVGVSALSVAPARAGTIVANVADGILTVTGTADGDDVTVRCEGGVVTVNQTEPSGGPLACGDLRRVLAFAGGGSDRVSLGEVTRSVFDSLAGTSLSGQEGDDQLIGSDGEDHLLGGGGVDSLRGGLGADRLEPGPGAGEAIGGKGRDRVSLSGDGDWTVNDNLARFVQAGEDTSLRSIEVAVIAGGAGANIISAGTFTGVLRLDGKGGGDLIQSGSANDTIVGGGGNDFLQSGAGNDELDGDGGDDVLRGDSGNDELDGGQGNDTCTGGPGADSVVSC